jgi:hypothetical protein
MKSIRLVVAIGFASVGLLGVVDAAAYAYQTDTPPDSTTPESTAPEPTTPPSSSAPSVGALDAAPCALVAATVDGGTASFTVGPQDCFGEVGPISFSSYELPSGDRRPFEDQVLIAHAAANGSFYAVGSYMLSASLADAACWQSDLYFGQSDDHPPIPNLIAYDYHECEAPAATTTPTTSNPTVVVGPAAAPPEDPEPTTTVLVAGAGGTVGLSPTTTVQVASAGPTTSVAPEAQTLPKTGQSTLILLTSAAGATGIGLLARRLGRRSTA